MNGRRLFLRRSGAAAIGLGLGKWGEASPARSSGPDEPRIAAYRTLGRTGLSISDVGCGSINLFTPNVLRYAYDRGVNHFDTAEAYLNTNSEKYLGEATQGIRGKVILTTKHLLRGPADFRAEALIARVEASLKRLRTNYLDVAMVHAVDQPDRLAHPEVLAAYTRLKKDGKARFIGFSAHATARMLAAAEGGPWDVALIVYNHMEGPAFEEAISRAREKGLGIIAMKVLAGGMHGRLEDMIKDRLTYARAAIRWVLGNPHIDACLSTMSTYSHVEEYVGASGRPMDRRDASVLARYRAGAGSSYCRISCGDCLSVCPAGVKINDVLRFAMYYESYGMERRAMEMYGELDESLRPEACRNCAAPCVEACPYGLPVRDRLVYARSLLSPSLSGLKP